jgi:hypothetical protein
VENIKFISDCDVWATCPTEWRWIYDKLIVAQHEGITSGPAGVSVPESGNYIVRPITNIRMMGRGARKCWLQPGDDESVPDGYFWSEILTGDHVSIDYHWSEPLLSVQGFRDNPNRLDRFSCWKKIDYPRALPDWLQPLGAIQEWINVEYIGGRAIEVHLRYNDDFANHHSDEIVPVWVGDDVTHRPGWSWYASASQDRLGFWTKNS